MELHEILYRIYELPLDSIAKIEPYVKLVRHEKGHLLMQANRLEKHVYLIKKGLVRAYSDSEKGEITFWFGEEGDAVLSMVSYVMNAPSYDNISLIESCELYAIAISDLQKLYEKDIHLANWGRKLAEIELIKVEQRIISRELLSATARYNLLMKQQPSLLRRVPLKFIASYLGITQVSLSRIRGQSARSNMEN